MTERKPFFSSEVDLSPWEVENPQHISSTTILSAHKGGKLHGGVDAKMTMESYVQITVFFFRVYFCIVVYCTHPKFLFLFLLNCSPGL